MTHLTSAKESRFYIADPKEHYRLCDRLDIVIEMRDIQGRLKTTGGGDFFRVTIYNDKLKAGASSDGQPQYIGEGRYKAINYINIEFCFLMYQYLWCYSLF